MDTMRIIQDLNDCSDEEFAEVFVGWYKNWTGGDPRKVTVEDMRKADVNVIADKIRDILDEVIYSKEVCTSAWWKKMDFLDDQEKMTDLFELTKDEFLRSYNYLTEEEYDATIEKAIKLLNERRN